MSTSPAKPSQTTPAAGSKADVQSTPGAAPAAQAAKGISAAKTPENVKAADTPKAASNPKPADKPKPGNSVKSADSPKAASQAANAAQPEPAGGAEAAPIAEAAPRFRFILFKAVPGWLVSAAVHFVGMLVLALITVEPQTVRDALQISAAPPEQIEQIEEMQDEQIEINLDEMMAETQTDVVAALTQDIVETTETPTVAMDVDAAPIAIELSDIGEQTAPKNDLMATVGAFTGSGLSGRGMAEQGAMVAKYGGNEASQAAVAKALKWFANHQLPDGSWNFDHRMGPCNGRCGHPGNLADCRTGATAMALLPFLGAGQTHKQGTYKKNVEAGLYFLTSQIKVRNQGGLQCGDLAQGGGSMYSHGLAAIVLCEAYAMTNDRALMAPAQLSLNHIVYAQDPIGGGWRYQPRTPGDTSVVGWQLMALKSGHMAYLTVPPATIQGSIKFLDSVQADGGGKYGYTSPGAGQGTTSVGLLCRMYLGWKKDHPGIQRGVDYISRLGPSKGNMYYNYYATQVMRHYGGEPGSEGWEKWEKWNNEMRDWLVSSQEKKGHEEGSWHMSDPHADRGGRLYCTSMATMILEVYYRHMPIYGKQAAEEEFPL